jgi:hypothetical protein
VPSAAENAEKLRLAKLAGNIVPTPGTRAAGTPPTLPPVGQMDPHLLSPLPSSYSTAVDQLRAFETNAVPQTTVAPLPALASVQANAASASTATRLITPVSKTAAAAQSTANSASASAAVSAATLATPALSAIGASGAVDSTQAYFDAKGGAIPPQIVGSSASLFSYTATASTHTIAISWSGFTVYFADGTTATVSSGSQNVTGVGTGTYYFYAALNSSNVVTFVAVSGGTGTPAVLYSPQSPTASQAMNGQSVTALSNGGVQVVMPSSGGGSGGGGGSQLCARADQFVRTRERGVVRLRECEIGEWLDSRHGYAQIKNLKFVKQSTFIKFTTHTGESLSVTPTHCLTVLRQGIEQSVDAARVTLMDVLYHVGGFATIKKIEITEDDLTEKAIIHLEPTHEYWCGETSPTINAANAVPIS